MTVGVLTFHRCINYGSYWQARCLVEGVRALGHDAVLLDHDDPHIRREEWVNALGPQRPAHTPRHDMRRYAAKTRRFLAAFERLPQSRRFPLAQPEEAGSYDAVLVGSDEVWNFCHPWYGSKPIFFGERLRTRRLTSYAASFGNHDAGVDPRWAESLARFDALSVRDENSRALVAGATGREPALVLDPCLQFPPPPVRRGGAAGRYLAVYGQDFPPWFAAALRGWADRRGMHIVSIGYRNAFADAQALEVGPEEFSELIAQADAVATNFFHGCVFATLHERPFVAAPSAYRMHKVRDLARRLGAERHVVTAQTPPSEYDALLSEALAPVIAERLAAQRAASAAFVRDALG